MFLSLETWALLGRLGLAQEDAAAVVRAVRADLRALEAVPRSAEAERAARYRERKALAAGRGVTKGAADVTPVTILVTTPVLRPLLEPKVSPEPPSKTQSSSSPHPPLKGGLPPSVESKSEERSPTVADALPGGGEPDEARGGRRRGRASGKPPRAPRPIPDPPGFDAFWEAYPLKVGRHAAARAFERVVLRAGGEDPTGPILAAVARAKAGRRWRDGFTPNPATWLNQGRWLDGDPAPQATGPPPLPSPEVLAWRLRHYADTGEWRPPGGEAPPRPGRNQSG